MGTPWVLLASGIYLALLFLVAYRVDAGGRWRRAAPDALVYGLSMAVYCTSWTFYGSVGYATRHGYEFLAVYVGPALVFLFARPVLAKLVAVCRTHHLTSIADLIAARFGRRRSLAAVVTLIALIGVMPYISLQLKAVTSTFDLLAGATRPSHHAEVLADTGFYLTIAMGLFVSVFATRRVDASEQHRGLMTAIALESLVKLLAFLAVGVFVVYGLAGGYGALLDRLAADPGLGRLADLGGALGRPNFWILAALAGLAIFTLPRQFQVIVVENTDPAHLRTAGWMLPLYLLLINLFVLPIAAYGLLSPGLSSLDPDTYLLALPLAAEAPLLALFAFIGGLSAATGMIIVETAALATMVSNDLVLPLVLRRREQASVVGLVKAVRRLSIFVVLGVAYLYVRLIGDSTTLVGIGLVSFVAAAQFAPAMIGGLYWRRADGQGALLGLLAGFALWAYTLLIPSFALSGWIDRGFVDQGPFGLAWLKPYALFGSAGLTPVAHGLVWSLAANLAFFVAWSLLRRPDEDAAGFAAAFVALDETAQKPRLFDAPVSGHDLHRLAARYVGAPRAEQALDAYRRQRALPADPAWPADAGAIGAVEKLIAGAIGSSQARIVVGAAFRERQADVGGVLDLLQDASQQIDVQWERMREAIEHIDQGISMFDRELRLIVCNRRFLEIYDFPESVRDTATTFADLIRRNAGRGEYGAGEVEVQVAERVARAQRFEAHHFERRRPNGQVLEIRGRPLPTGGFVATYTDVTERRRIEEALREANESLESRVRERTRALSASEARFRDFTETASDWFWETDADLRFTAFSQRIEEATGMPSELMLGRQRWDLVSPGGIDAAPADWAQHRAMLEARQPFRNFEYGGRFPDGGVRRFRISGKPVFDADGVFQGYRGTGTDVTALAAAQAELLRAEKMAALGGLVAGVAHEINTPVGIGLTGATYLEERTREIRARFESGTMKRSDLERYLAAAGETAASLSTNLRRAGDLVQSFKQVAVDQSSERRRRFRLQEYLGEILASLHPKFKRTKHEVEVDCPPELELDSYPGVFSQIVTNLVLNALVHGFEHVEAGHIRIAARVEGATLILSIADDGAGMTPEVAHRAFDPFFTTKRGRGGSGLGLHIVYNLVTQRLSGQIECRTAPGAGVTFVIRIPV